MYETNDKMVSHPSHYQTKNGLEVIDIIDALTEDLTGIEAVDTANAIKYIARWKKKNGVQDIEKAIWYLTHLKDHLISKEMNEIGESLVRNILPSEDFPIKLTKLDTDLASTLKE